MFFQQNSILNISVAFAHKISLNKSPSLFLTYKLPLSLIHTHTHTHTHTKTHSLSVILTLSFSLSLAQTEILSLYFSLIHTQIFSVLHRKFFCLTHKILSTFVSHIQTLSLSPLSLSLSFSLSLSLSISNGHYDPCITRRWFSRSSHTEYLKVLIFWLIYPKHHFEDHRTASQY